MTDADNSSNHAHGPAGSPWQPGQPVVPGTTRRRFLTYTALGTAAAAGGAAGVAGVAGGIADASVRGASTAAQGLPKGWTGTIADVKHVVILSRSGGPERRTMTG